MPVDKIRVGESMGFFQHLADHVDDTAEAAGKFADALVRLAGATVVSTFALIDRELAYAQRAAKEGKTGRVSPARGPGEKPR